MPEFKLTVNRDNAPDPTSGKLAGARAAKDKNAEAIRSRRSEIHQRHKAEAAGQEAEAEKKPADEPLPPREDIDTIEVTIRNGLTITYGPPSGISLTDRLTRFYGDRDPTVAQHRLARILMCVQEINGKAVPAIADEIDRTKLANRIGDEGIDLLMYYDRLYWPPLRQAELPQVKKNLRGA